MWIKCEIRNLISLLVFIILTTSLSFPFRAVAAPVLNFSDIDSGPKSGNTDGYGSGAIVTVWGNGLGSSIGESKIYVGEVEVTTVYYWKDADGTLPGGPADLKTFHKMQEVAFAIPSGADSGANPIKINVSGVDSNKIPFTVRHGNIYFIRSGGNDTAGDGSWGNPWATLQNVMSGNGKLSPGDIVYSVGVVSASGISVGSSGKISGTAANPVSLIAYPNTPVDVSGKSYSGYVIFNFNNQDDNSASTYINLSKLSITAAGDGIDSSSGIRAFLGNRIVGVEITGPTVYGGYGGAICGNHIAAGGGKYFGVYIHNYGTDNGVPYNGNTGTNPDNCSYSNSACKTSWDVFQHLYYLSNRTGVTADVYEIGWNHLTDNPIWQGIHIYDQGTVGGWNGTFKIHHNVVKNQRGGAIEVDLQSTMSVNPQIEIYNNIIISDIADTYNFRAFQLKARNCNVKVYNNTVYGYNSSNVFQNLSTDYRNNIMVDTKGVSFVYDAITMQSNNLFYSTKNTPKPVWASSESGNIYADPFFVNPVNHDFSLKPESPARYSGSDRVLSTTPTHFFNNARKAGYVSIGAIDYLLPPQSLIFVD